ncbi:hypothetical protein NU688_10475 [Variovorax sp. ZS18.2.2]|uniref:hypothetical protein n=1 Tax=Variovorax sp. ZS18.2.2 TaxID=2971255 RepID=UPI002150C8CE|nr:hypothetical protein [Variovorax sp. ZS18.2.2]MCR6476582.1 hypothetical protein [Variovorax sp. ZS18.2.2]
MKKNLFDEQRISEIQARATAAAPGPWKGMIEGRDHLSGSSCISRASGGIDLDGASDADIDFMANARQDVPYLISELRRLAALIDSSS